MANSTIQTHRPGVTTTPQTPRVKCGHCGAYETVPEVFWCSQFDPAAHSGLIDIEPVEPGEDIDNLHLT